MPNGCSSSSNVVVVFELPAGCQHTQSLAFRDSGRAADDSVTPQYCTHVMSLCDPHNQYHYLSAWLLLVDITKSRIHYFGVC